MSAATTEARCLLALARGDERPPAAVGGIDGDRFFRLACRHGVASLCHSRLIQLPPASPWIELSRPAAKRLQMVYLHYVSRARHLLRQLNELQTEFHERSIDAVFFKGPWLAFKAYPTPATRPMSDIDIGVREEAYERVGTALRSLGYRSKQGLPSSDSGAIRRAHFGKQLRLRAPGRLPIELHFRIINCGPPSADEEWMWGARSNLDTDGASLSVPGAEAMLLHLLIHANQHGFAKLRLLYDIRFACHQIMASMNADRFLQLVDQLQCKRSAYFGLMLARDLAGAEVSEQLLKALKPSFVHRVVFSRLWRLSASRTLESTMGNETFEAVRFYLLEMGRVSQKCAYMRGISRECGGPVGMVMRAAKAMTSMQ